MYFNNNLQYYYGIMNYCMNDVKYMLCKQFSAFNFLVYLVKIIKCDTKVYLYGNFYTSYVS